MNQFEQIIAGKMNLKIAQIEAVLALFAEGATIPFIARYRKDKTGALDEVQIQQIQDEMKTLTEFAERKEFIETEQTIYIHIWIICFVSIYKFFPTR